MLMGERVLNYRVAHGLSQQAFADRAGVSKSTIAHLELQPDMVLKGITIKRIEFALGGGCVRKEEA